MKIAVTGGAGELGRRLVPHLQQHGHSVVSIDRAAPPGWGTGVHHMAVDVGDLGQFVYAVHGCDALIHLAARISPFRDPEPLVYADNTRASYNALAAAQLSGITRICLASSINAIGGIFSQHPRYDYFPVDELHPARPEDAYSLSKWVLEQQADAFALRHPELRIASLRFHGLRDTRDRPDPLPPEARTFISKHLWGYTLFSAAVDACLRAVTAEFTGHQPFFIVAPDTMMNEPSAGLSAEFFPNTPVRGDLSGQRGFYDCAKAQRLLGWVHP